MRRIVILAKAELMKLLFMISKFLVGFIGLFFSVVSYEFVRPMTKWLWDFRAICRFGLTCPGTWVPWRDEIRGNKNMKKRICLFTAALCSAAVVLLASSSYAQKAGAASKAEAIAQQLNLTPQQKIKILPILRDEAPKVNAIKKDNSLSKIQKIQQIRAIHQQTDPQMKAILTPVQYEKLKTIRQQAIRDATQSRSPT